MPGTFMIRIKALFLSAVFAGNFFGVCHCSAAVVDSTAVVNSAASMRMNGKKGHCCCHKAAQPCKETRNCPGTHAVKFNQLEKKAAATVCLSPSNAMLVA